MPSPPARLLHIQTIAGTSFLKHPVTIVATGAGNRACKYLEYAVRHPERLRPAGVVEPNPLRRKALADKFGIDPEHCFAGYNRFFEPPQTADAVLIATPENERFKPCIQGEENVKQLSFLSGNIAHLNRLL